MSSGGGDTEWGNGQPGNQSYDPGYGTAAQNPNPLNLQGSPEGGAAAGGGGFNPDTTSGNIFTSGGVTSSASTGGTGNGGGTPNSFSSGSPGFDVGTPLAGASLGYLNDSGVQSSYGGQVPGYGTTDLGSASPNLNTSMGTDVRTGAPTGQAAAPGLPGVGGGTDLTAQQPRSGGGGPSGSSEGKGILDSLGIKNPLGAAIGAAGLGYQALQGQKPPAFTPQMKAQADQLSAQGQQLMSYLQSGNLPPGLKAGLDQATASAKAKIISNFASQGLNTDPRYNSALADQLAQVDQQALISTAQVGQQLLSTGVTETGLSSDLYKTLAQIDATQTANIGKAIANFAQAISGSGGGTTIRLG